MKVGLVLGLAVPLLAGAMPAYAQRTSRVDGNKLLQVCTSKTGTTGCEAYISGVSDTIALLQRGDLEAAPSAKISAMLCVPKSAAGPELRATVINWLQQHPNNRRSQAAQVVYRALREKYGCR